MPDEAQLKILWDDNPDGAGYAWWDHEKEVWHCKKGIMKWEHFQHELETDSDLYGFDTKAVLIHTRIATSGPLDGSDTHPYPIAPEEVDWQRDIKNYSCSSILMHNGIYSKGTKKESDTQEFVRTVMWPLNYALSDSNPELDSMWWLLDDLMDTGSNRWVITKGKSVNLFGKWIFDKETGCYFSNDRYLEENTYYQWEKSKSNNTYNNYDNHIYQGRGWQSYPSQIHSVLPKEPDDYDHLGWTLVNCIARHREKDNFLTTHGNWDWQLWDNRYTEKKKTELESKQEPNAVYDEHGRLLWYIEDDDETDDTTIPTITCITCGMHMANSDLNDGECPACGIILVPQEEDHICPYCQNYSWPYQGSLDPNKVVGLEEISFCKSCNIVYGVVSEGGSIGSEWIIGWLGADMKINYVKDQMEG